MWCCRSSMAGCWRALSHSKIPCRPMPNSRLPHLRAGPSRIASLRWPIASPRLCACRRSRPPSGASPGRCPIIRARPAAPALRSGLIFLPASWPSSAPSPPATRPVADSAKLPRALRAGLATRTHDAWGDPADDPDARAGRFWFRVGVYGNIAVVLPPDRGRQGERRADYHDPALPPRHALVAFWLWLRHVFRADALVHMGAHGTLEWLPGKAVALTAACFPEAIIGALPVFYPFIVSNPGEAAQAKPPIAAPPLVPLPPPLP